MADNNKPRKINLSILLENARLKYPKYRDVPDTQLFSTIVKKYPQYRNYLTRYDAAVGDVISGAHDPLKILDPQASIAALKKKYPDAIKDDDAYVMGLLTDGFAQRINEDPDSTIAFQHRPFNEREIADMPKFMQKSARMSGLGLNKEPNPQNVASVVGVGTDINIDRPTMFDRGVMSHELTHAYQNLRNQDFRLGGVDADYSNIDKVYDYGGLPGLQRALKERKTISSFNPEQQADIVKSYYELHKDFAKKGAVSKQDAEDFEEMKAAYGPFVRQLAEVPMEDEMGNPIKPKTTPDVPSYRASGFITGDPNIMDFQIPVSK